MTKSNALREKAAIRRGGGFSIVVNHAGRLWRLDQTNGPDEKTLPKEIAFSP